MDAHHHVLVTGKSFSGNRLRPVAESCRLNTDSSVVIFFVVNNRKGTVQLFKQNEP
jgi:hypothetical protein